MMKESENVDDFIPTEPATPPSLELQVPTSHQLIQRIISSNEQLIHQQMLTIRSLQQQNYDQQLTIKQLQAKYQSLLEFVQQKQSPHTKNCSITEDSSSGKTSVSQQKQPVGAVDDLLSKVVYLQQQLSITKVELAVKSADLLKFSLKSRDKQDASSTRYPEKALVELESLFDLTPIKKNNSITEKKAEEGEYVHLVEQWTRVLQQLGSGECQQLKLKQKTASLIRKYIPRQVRSKVWDRYIQNRLGMTNALYIELLQRREKGWVCEKVKQQIQKDIKRSFYGKTNYETKTGIILEVVQFLELFHVFRPDVSYVQGMTYPAIILIPILGKIRAFNVFCNLILGNTFMRKLFSLQAKFINSVCRGFQVMLEEYNPAVSRKLKECAVQSEIYLIEWLFTFFSRGFAFETTLKFWDHLLYFEELSFFRMSLAIFEQIGPSLLNMSYEQIVGCVREYGLHLSEDKLMECFASSKLSAQKLARSLERGSMVAAY